jgi:hypothetical protein
MRPADTARLVLLAAIGARNSEKQGQTTFFRENGMSASKNVVCP